MTYDQQLISEGLCPNLVPAHDPDGYPVDGRCGRPITDMEVAACEYHAEEIREWHQMSEYDKMVWEQNQEDW